MSRSLRKNIAVDTCRIRSEPWPSYQCEKTNGPDESPIIHPILGTPRDSRSSMFYASLLCISGTRFVTGGSSSQGLPAGQFHDFGGHITNLLLAQFREHRKRYKFRCDFFRHGKTSFSQPRSFVGVLHVQGDRVVYPALDVFLRKSADQRIPVLNTDGVNVVDMLVVERFQGNHDAIDRPQQLVVQLGV